MLLVADQRRRELDDRVAAVVGAAVEAGVEQRLGQEAAQQPLALLVVEGLLGGLVLDQLDAVEVAVAADVADDRQVVQLLERRPERGLVVAARAR